MDLQVLYHEGAVCFGQLSRALHLDHYPYEIAGLLAVYRLPQLGKPQPVAVLNAGYGSIGHWLHSGVLAEEKGELGVLAGSVVRFLLHFAFADLICLPDRELLLPVEGELPEEAG